MRVRKLVECVSEMWVHDTQILIWHKTQKLSNKRGEILSLRQQWIQWLFQWLFQSLCEVQFVFISYDIRASCNIWIWWNGNGEWRKLFRRQILACLLSLVAQKTVELQEAYICFQAILMRELYTLYTITHHHCTLWYFSWNDFKSETCFVLVTIITAVSHWS